MIPPEARQPFDEVDLEALYNHSERFPSVRKEVDRLKKFIENKLHRRVLAEMHGRIAYGIGCFLLVAAGAALGAIFRGGNLLSAFALSCVPGMVLIILQIMGKQMVCNPDVRPVLGLSAIWSGVGILGAMVAYLHGFVLRR